MIVCALQRTRHHVLPAFTPRVHAIRCCRALRAMKTSMYAVRMRREVQVAEAKAALMPAADVARRQRQPAREAAGAKRQRVPPFSAPALIAVFRQRCLPAMPAEFFRLPVCRRHRCLRRRATPMFAAVRRLSADADVFVKYPPYFAEA